MMFGLSLNFFEGGYTIDAPTSLWWKQLATAVVFGLGIATVLTLVFTPAMLAVRVWTGRMFRALAIQVRALRGRNSDAGRDLALRRAARKARVRDVVWGGVAAEPATAGTPDPWYATGSGIASPQPRPGGRGRANLR